MDQVTPTQLFAEVGSLYMALKLAREERDALKDAVETLKRQNATLVAEIETHKQTTGVS